MAIANYLAAAALLFVSAPAAAQSGAARAAEHHVIGRLSANPYAPTSTASPAQRFDPDSVTNPFGRYGSMFSPTGAANPNAIDTPALIDSAGRYRGKLSANRYDADSVSNPYGRYGSAYSADSINNRYGAGNKFAPDSPHNPHGVGLRIVGKE